MQKQSGGKSATFEEMKINRSSVIDYLAPFGGLGKIVSGVMQMLGVPKADREVARGKVDEAVASGQPCLIVFELGEYRYRVRIG